MMEKTESPEAGADKVAWGQGALRIRREGCITLRSGKPVCQLCAEACPEECLEASANSISLSELKCVECGLCVSLCPSSVFSLARYGKESVMDILETAGSSEEIVLACQRSAEESWKGKPAAKFICLGVIDGSQMARLALAGVKSVLIAAPCSTCPITSGEGVIAQTAMEAEALARSMGFEIRIAFDTAQTNTMAHAAGTRRGLLLEAGKALAKAALAKAAIATAHEIRNGRLEPVPTSQRSRRLNKYAEIIAGKNGNLREDGSPFRVVTISGDCVLCDACASYCPAGALAKRDNPWGVEIEFTAKRCVKCRGCRELCPEGAIEYTSEFPAAAALGGPAVLRSAGKAPCVSCEKPFIPAREGQTRCVGCLKLDKFQDNLYSMYLLGKDKS
jgi:Fe-S-cluster-containing hydrogenase component 2